MKKKVHAILANYLPNVSIPRGNKIGVQGYAVWTDHGNGLATLFDNYILNKNIWESFANGISGATVTGGPTAELLMNSYNTKNGTNLDYTNWPSLRVIDSLYFPYESAVTVDNKLTVGYFLATGCDGDSLYTVRCKDGHFIYYASYWGGGTGNASHAVRPVVCMSFDTLASKIGDVWKVGK